MQVIFHLGAPCTDDDLLVKSLLKNRRRLMKSGVCVPPPGRYRTVIRDTSRALKGRPASEDVQDALLNAIVDNLQPDRLILSDPRFICINRLVIQGAQIWPAIERQTNNLRTLFPEAEIEFHFGMRDPATLIPALFKSSRFADFNEFTENMQHQAVTWSEMLHRLRAAQPDAGITVWANEDTPFLWGEVMREMAGVDQTSPLAGVDDLIETIMQPAGFERMQAYLAKNPPENEMHRRRILGAFLDKYALEDEIEDQMDVPGWTEELMDELSETYDADLDAISRIPGVNLLMP